MSLLHRKHRKPRTPMTEATARYLDERLGSSSFAKSALDKVFPDHWSFMFGELAMYSFLILLASGVYLTFFFVPSERTVTYTGPYKPLQGGQMSEAYASVMHISFEVRAGLVMRQMHHWAALIFVGTISIHLMRIFFTGAFRRPREINWVIGVGLMVLAIVEGFAGYSLADDLLSGTGLRIANAIMLAVPVAGEWLASLVFGGEFPGSIIPRLTYIHVLIVPALIVGLLTAHLMILWRQKHTDFGGKGKTEDTITGSQVWPTYAMKSAGLLFFVAAACAGLGGLVQINPIWLYGPYQPAEVSSASQPDWYMGWLDGGLRMMPNLEIRLFGHTVSNLFFPGVLFPTVAFGLLAAWPWIERRFTKDRDAHNLLDRPRDRPTRTGIGVGGIVAYIVLFAGSSTDILATTFHISFERTIHTLQVLVVALPVLAFFTTRRVCRELSRGRVRPIRRPEGGVITRDADGHFQTAERAEDRPNDEGGAGEAEDDENIGADPLRPGSDWRIRT